MVQISIEEKYSLHFVTRGLQNYCKMLQAHVIFIENRQMCLRERVYKQQIQTNTRSHTHGKSFEILLLLVSELK
jgi:hypothetical protein